MKQRILFFQTNSGMGNGVAMYIRALVRSMQKSVECHIAAYAAESDRSVLAAYYEVPAQHVLLMEPRTERNIFQSVVSLRAYIKSRAITLVHSHALRSGFVVSIARLLSFSFPATVYTNHGLRFRQLSNTGAKLLWLLFECFASRSHDVTVSIAPSDLSIIARYRLSARRRSFLVRTRMDLDTPARRAPSGFSVVCVGEPTTVKGVDRFICAARDLISRLPGVKFTWVGGAQPSIDHSSLIHWTGQVSHEAVLRYLDSSSIYLFCSRIDTYPLALLEAYSRGLPALFISECDTDAYRPSAMPCFLPNQLPTAISALHRLVQSPSELHKLSSIAQQWFRANAQNASLMAREYEILYSTAAHQR